MAIELDVPDPFAPAPAQELDVPDPFAAPQAEAQTPEEPSYAGRLGTAAGLGLKNLAAGAKYGIEQTAAEPVAVAAGTADFLSNAAELVTPIGLAKRIFTGGLAPNASQDGSIADKASALADGILDTFKNAPITDAINTYVPGAMDIGAPGAQAYADQTRAAIQDTNAQLEANKAAGGDLGLDAATAIAQMAPAAGVGLATRSPRAAAAALAGPMYGQTLSEGEGPIEERAQRAAAFTGAEYVTELPVAKLLTLPAKAIVREFGETGLRQALGHVAKTAGKEFTQEFQTQVMQDLYDRGALDEEKGLGDMLANAGYAGLVGGIAGGAVGVPAAVATARQSAQAGPADTSLRDSYIASLTEADDGEGGRVLVDPSGAPVGTTLDEAKASAAAMSPEDMQARMQPATQEAAPAEQPAQAPAATSEQVATPETEVVQAETPFVPPATTAEPNAADANAVPATPSSAPIPAREETNNAPLSPLQRGRRAQPDANAEAAPPETQDVQAERQPPAAVAAGRPAGAARLSDAGVGGARPEALGGGTDSRGVSGERADAGATEREVESGRAALATLDARNEPDAALTESNGEWASFDEASGTLGIPRAEMPQVKAEHRGALVNFLGGKGVEHATEEVDAATLKPTQAEFSPAKVAQAKEYQGGDRSIIISSDGHVVDGHHQWLARRESGEPVKVIRLNKPISEVLPLVKEFPSATASKQSEPKRSPMQRGSTPAPAQEPDAPAAEFTSAPDAAAPAATAPSDEWKAKKGASRLQALVSKSRDVAPDAYEDARLPGYMGEAVDAMATLFKKDVVVFRAKEGTDYAPGGLLFPADPSTIYLNADANVAPAVVFMHEMVHSMKRTDPETYAKLEKAVGKLLRNKQGYVEKRLRGKKLSDELVTEEMIADVMADHASTPQFWSDLYARFEDKNAWAKFVEHIRALFSNVIDTLYPIGANNYVSDFNAAYQAVVDAAYNHARAQHGDVASDGQVMEMPSGSQTDTPEFKRWFGDSKVVDADGKPLVVYHGTTADLHEFDLAFSGSDGVKYGAPAVFATSDANLASDYAANKFDRVIADAMRALARFKNENPGTYDERYEAAYAAVRESFKTVSREGRAETGGGANVLPLYMALQNPLVVEADGRRFMQVMPESIAQAVAEGRDGLIVNNVRDHASPASDYPAQVMVAFLPEQIKSAIGNRGTFDPNNPSILESPMLSTPPQGSPPSQSLLDEGNAWWRAGARMWDNMNRMRILQDKAVEKGLALQDKMNVWVRENLSRSKMRVMADKVTDDYQRPILEMMKKADLTLKQVDDFIYAKHAPERNREIAKINPKFPDGGSGMKNAEAARILKSYTPEQTKALDAIAQKLYDMQAYKLSIMEQHGLTEPSEIARLKALYKHYVPLKTIEEETDAPGNTGRGIEVKHSEYKAALGRASRATSPLMVSFQDMARTLVRAHKNDAGNALLSLARDPVLATMLDAKSGKPIVGVADPADYMRPVTDAQGNVSMAVPSNWWQSEDIFITKENGVQRYIAVRDPELMAQLRRMGDADIGNILQAVGGATRLFARMLTQYNPVFAPVNLIRDAIQASILSLGVPGLNPVKVMAGILPNMARILAHKLKPNARYTEFLEDGASTNAYGLRDLEDALNEVENVGIDLGYTPPGKSSPLLRGTKRLGRKAWRRVGGESVFQALAWYNEAFENAVRLSTYNAMRDIGVSREQAAFQSKELSTNFNKKGQWSSAMNAAYVFVNAAMQGNRALLKFAKRPGVQAALVGLVAAGVLQDMLGAAFGGEDDKSGLKNIDEVGDWALDHNIIILTGPDKQVKIPLPYGLNLPFVFGRRVSKAIRTGNGFTQLSGILNVMADNFSPIGGFEPVIDPKTGEMNVTATTIKTILPSLLRPAMSVATNSNFMGQPIARTPFQGDQTPPPRSVDFKPGTHDLAVDIAAWLNKVSGGDKAKPGDLDVSPEHIEFLVGEYSGGAGRFVSDVSGIGIKLATGKAPEIEWSRAPFIRSFSGVDSRSDAYARYRQISTDAKYTDDQRKAGEPFSPLDRSMLPMVKNTDSRLKTLRKQRKAAYEANNMARVKEIQEEEQRLIKSVVKEYNARKQKPPAT